MCQGAKQIKFRNSTSNRILIVEFVKKMVYLGAHYSEYREISSFLTKDHLFLHNVVFFNSCSLFKEKHKQNRTERCHLRSCLYRKYCIVYKTQKEWINVCVKSELVLVNSLFIDKNEASLNCTFRRSGDVCCR